MGCLLKDAMASLFASRLFGTCCGMLFLAYGLGYAYLGRVCKGIGSI